ncbi:hypothetical protein DRE_02298 [Drechslerella stenobrocha 248]|uniref:BZIP domain-containing protein n=1 Tax=Drechslerella stenobrocha 248 TaxID=1043628 RepID=W7HXF1_9PEZI|nr:hypothetical protein DRE_02298 [Drechslerella stenobrocha 248]
MTTVAKHPAVAGASLTVADLPSNQLTPNFFNSIFNDGMNPFDEYFGASAAAAAGISLSASPFRREYQSDKAKLIKDEALPTIHTRLDQTLTPEQSPKSLTGADGAFPSRLATRSPSPFTFSLTHAIPDSPVSPITPITSPEELSPNDAMTIEQATTLPFMASIDHEATRKSLSLSMSAKHAAAHKRNMSLPQSWSSATQTLQQIPAALDQTGEPAPSRKQSSVPRTSSRTRTRFSDPPVPRLISRMDGIFVTESVTPSDIKTEPASPTTPAFQSSSSAGANSRKRKKSVADDEDEDTSHLNDAEKRARFLERNRIAASKCRKKKKIMNQRLEEKSRLLIQQNRFLSATVAKLRSDVLRLKQMVLAHHGCGNAPIEQYLQQESEKYLTTSGDRAAKKLKTEAASAAIIAETNGATRADNIKPPTWLNEFHSFQELETEALKRTNHLLDFDDDDFQKLLLGDQLTLMDEEFATSPPCE